jgi:hypothetical protein
MPETVTDRFLGYWDTYFPGADLPIVFYYTDQPERVEPASAPDGWRCVIADLAQVRRGKALAFDVESLGCIGAKRYFGMSHEQTTDLEYFLSCGLPEKDIEGIRYRKTPELVTVSMAQQPLYDAPGKYIVFKRLDTVTASDNPVAVIFFVSADILSALFGLAHFDRSDSNGVISPSGSGCSSIVYYPFREASSDDPKAVLGMFDLSARPYVAPDILTMAIPWMRFAEIVENMPESFLITDSWDQLRKRLPDK